MAYKKNSKFNKKKGSDAEERFFMRFKDVMVKKATKNQDIKEHWDVIITNKQGEDKKIDIKSANIEPNILRVELINRQGKGGWATGQADFIAFEEGEAWRFVKRDKLLVHAIENLKPVINEQYVIYCRWYQPNTQAMMTYIPLEALETYLIV